MILKEIAFAKPRIGGAAPGCDPSKKIEVKVRKLSIAAAALAAAMFLPASAFALTGPAHPAAQASTSVMKVADVYRPVRHYRRRHAYCAPRVYGCGCGSCGCGLGLGLGLGLGWGSGWGSGCGCGGGGFGPFW
jgi:hypothetical protein